MKTRAIFLTLSILFSVTFCHFLKDESSNFNAVDQENLLFLDQHSDEQEEITRNFNEIPDLDDHHHHGAGVLFLGGFLRGLNLFQNVTHQEECGSLIAVIHDDIAEICSRIRNITDQSEIIEALKFIIVKLEDIQEHVKSGRKDCKQMCDEMKAIMDKVGDHLHQKDKMKEISQHFFRNLPTFIQKAENVKDKLHEHDFYRAGINAGDIVNFFLLWDFHPQVHIPKLINIQ